MGTPQVSVSVVSHGQADLVRGLVSDLDAHCAQSVAEILLTENLREGLDARIQRSTIPIRIVSNPKPKGFGANHNQAFRLARGDYFCVANPDIRFDQNPFEKLLECMSACQAALAAPRVIDDRGAIEDSARRLPTPFKILKKALGLSSRLDYADSGGPLYPDWVAGMFMLFSRETFAQIGGFDERFHLYYEDVDICARLRLSGQRIVLCPEAVIVHAARRESHKNPRYLSWHLRSMLRFFTSRPYFRYLRLCRERKRPLSNATD